MLDHLQHWAFYGVTMSGKTTAARYLARKEAEAGYRIIVFDPCMTDTAGGGWPQNATIFHHETDDDIADDPNSDKLADEFCEYLLRRDVRDAFVYVDESHKVYSHEQKHNFWHLDRGRHRGLLMRIITQRPNKVHPTARSQCTGAFMFALTKSDRESIAADYGVDLPKDLVLDKGDFLLFNTPSPTYSRANIFNYLKDKSCPP